jgi:hypothetical protein
MYLLLSAISSSFNEILKRNKKNEPKRYRGKYQILLCESWSPALLSVENNFLSTTQAGARDVVLCYYPS